ncbi:hypothetical protein RMATCC62417_00387 [Rhizopus microsporus]|nr:hypothetical protein RMATCC62417_00387 [Rhizopus microsporus]
MASSLRGIFVPIPTFFKENEDLDLDSLDLHIQYLSKSGIAGIVVLGSMGEAVSLLDEERDQVIKQVVTSVKKYNPSLIIIAGTSSQSARNVISYTRQAAAAGAQYCLILPPSFYRSSITDDALVAFYTAVADQSPLPIIIYNYPGVCQGIDVSTKALVQLSKHKNIVGLKGTDANVGKMADLVQKTDPKEFALLAGSVDFFLPELLIGAVGLIPGAGNVFPALCAEIQRLYDNKQYDEAARLQRQLVEADDALCRWHGVPGAKSYIFRKFGYGKGICRNPLQRVTEDQAVKIEQAVDPVVSLEENLKSNWTNK